MPLKTIHGRPNLSGYQSAGTMDRLIDIWDQPPVGAPVLIQSGVYAQIVGVVSTSQSPTATTLGQNIAWPRLDTSRISLITHQVTIRYIPGLKSRMFLVYNDPDNGTRRFDIDRIVDPDEKKVELQILAVERNDGKDAFDAMLSQTADILVRDTSAGDSRGMSNPSFTTIATGIACRVNEGGGVPRGKEARVKTKLAIQYREVFMRPWFSDPSPDGSYVPYNVVAGVTYNTNPLTHDHWLLVPSSTSLNSKGQAVPGDMLDVLEINNPGLANHHLELWVQIVLP